MAASATGGVHAAAHITGGGLDGNLDRALPPELAARIDRTSWAVPEVFGLVASRGVPDDEMRRVFNMGIGFCLVADPGSVEAVLDATAAHSPRVIGEVAPGKGEGAG
jgi:phosphoribosylformylglycinamidine cyclo-ligase